MDRPAVRYRGAPPRRMVAPAERGNPFDIYKQIDELKSLYEKLKPALTFVEGAIKTWETVKKGPPGDPGKSGRPGGNGKDVTPEMVMDAVRRHVKQPENGISPKLEDVAQEVMGQKRFSRIVRKHLRTLAPTFTKEKGSDGDMPTLQIVMAELEKMGISEKFVQNIEARIAEVRNHVATGEGTWRGGGDTVVAGPGVTITETVNGNKKISASGTSLAIIAVAGAINDSNMSFTAASEPTLLNINGSFYQKTGGAITWTYVAGAITTSQPIGTGGAIFGV